LWLIDKNPRSAQHLAKLKKRYETGARYVAAHAGGIGLTGVLALCTFLVGWWVAIGISYVLNVGVKTTMKATTIGLLIGAGVSQASYEGLMKWLPNPLIVTAIILTIVVIIARTIGILAKREAASASPSNQISNIDRLKLFWCGNIYDRYRRLIMYVNNPITIATSPPIPQPIHVELRVSFTYSEKAMKRKMVPIRAMMPPATIIMSFLAIL
jgi:hypothetical protein